MITPIPLFNGALNTSANSLIYESPIDQVTTIKFGIVVNNGAGNGVTVNLYKKTSGGISSHIITPNLPLDNNESMELDGLIQLNPGDQILGDASVASLITLVLDGFQVAVV